MAAKTSSDLKLQLAGLLETLQLLTAQAQAYERALPADNYQARAAVAVMGELARQALAEAQELESALSPALAPDHPLSPRELEVLTLVVEGLSNKEIAYRLGLSERTIQFHLTSIFNKTNSSSRTEAATLALKQGWIKTGSD